MDEAVAEWPTSATNGSLTPRQYGAVPALVTSPTIKAAAAACGTGERTLHRWLQDRTFRALIDQAREEALQHALASLRAGTGRAVETLYRALEADSGPSRLRAATVILSMVVRLEEHRLARADALEGRLTRKESLEFLTAVSEAIREFVPDPTDKRDFLRELSRIQSETATSISGGPLQT
jgi:hypothetical protein